MEYLLQEIGIAPCWNSFQEAAFCELYAVMKCWIDLLACLINHHGEIKEDTLEGGIGSQDGCKQASYPSSDIHKSVKGGKIVRLGNRHIDNCGETGHSLIEDGSHFWMHTHILPDLHAMHMFKCAFPRADAIFELYPGLELPWLPKQLRQAIE